MGIKDQAKRIAAGASVALATSGLSNCHDNGAVDPPPPPLQCNTVDTGQSLTANATLDADTVEVTVRNVLGYGNWRVDAVSDVSGATLLSVHLPENATDSLIVRLRIADENTTQIAFAVAATLTGYSGESCAVTRTFHITLSGDGVQVSLRDADTLPLPARQHAEIAFAWQEGRIVRLEAKTAYDGERLASWSVSHGVLDAERGSAVRWTLPAEPGIYQAELVLDFGADGLAFDTLLLEVVQG
jgi:hypothetical protein